MNRGSVSVKRICRQPSCLQRPVRTFKHIIKHFRGIWIDARKTLSIQSSQPIIQTEDVSLGVSVVTQDYDDQRSQVEAVSMQVLSTPEPRNGLMAPKAIGEVQGEVRSILMSPLLGLASAAAPSPHFGATGSFSKNNQPQQSGGVPVTASQQSSASTVLTSSIQSGFSESKLKLKAPVPTLTVQQIPPPILHWKKIPLRGGYTPIPMRSHTACMLGSKMYIFGGCSDLHAFDDLFIFDTGASSPRSDCS
jgi:hypothetical protein